jgi:hypothetical protein
MSLQVLGERAARRRAAAHAGDRGTESSNPSSSSAESAEGILLCNCEEDYPDKTGVRVIRMRRIQPFSICSASDARALKAAIGQLAVWPPAARAARDLPLLKTPERTILASQRSEILGMSGKNKFIGCRFVTEANTIGKKLWRAPVDQRVSPFRA